MKIPLAERKALAYTLPWVTHAPKGAACEAKTNRSSRRTPRYCTRKAEFHFRPPKSLLWSQGERNVCFLHLWMRDLASMEMHEKVTAWFEKHPPEASR